MVNNLGMSNPGHKLWCMNSDKCSNCHLHTRLLGMLMFHRVHLECMVRFHIDNFVGYNHILRDIGYYMHILLHMHLMSNANSCTQ